MKISINFIFIFIINCISALQWCQNEEKIIQCFVETENMKECKQNNFEINEKKKMIILKSGIRRYDLRIESDPRIETMISYIFSIFSTHSWHF